MCPVDELEIQKSIAVCNSVYFVKPNITNYKFDQEKLSQQDGQKQQMSCVQTQWNML